MNPAERRASIVAAATPLLKEKGRALSTREIAKAAGIAEGTIFRVFETKDDIVHACLHEAFDTRALRVQLAAVDPQLQLRERLTVAVTVMQEHLEGIFALMGVLTASGRPVQRPSGPDSARRRLEATAELDEAFVRLIGEDAAALRIPVRKVIGILRMLTLSSVHPMLERQQWSADELVDVVLEGSLLRADQLAAAEGGQS